MMIHYGAIHYFNRDPREHPDLVVGVLKAVEDFAGPGRRGFQGMFAGTDKWSRKKAITARSLDQLAIDVRGGVYDAIVGTFGDETVGAVVSINCTPDSENWKNAYDLKLTTVLRNEAMLSQAEAVALRLWELCDSAHGISVLGSRLHEVSAELSAIPVNIWGEPEDPVEQERLFRLQELRPVFGEFARGAAWGNYLGSSLVERLGGLERLKREAPVSRVAELPGGGAYLRLSDRPLLLKTPEYERATEQLMRFLEPVLPPELLSGRS